jgi:hypothetical protein
MNKINQIVHTKVALTSSLHSRKPMRPSAPRFLRAGDLEFAKVAMRDFLTCSAEKAGTLLFARQGKMVIKGIMVGREPVVQITARYELRNTGPGIFRQVPLAWPEAGTRTVAEEVGYKVGLDLAKLLAGSNADVEINVALENPGHSTKALPTLEVSILFMNKHLPL